MTESAVLQRARRRRVRIAIIATVAILAVVYFAFAGFRAYARRPVPVPDLSRRTLDQAREVLAAAGLRVGAVSEVETANPAPGSVIDQAPTAPGPAPRGSAVAVTVVATPTVPNAVGLSEAEAKVRISTAGLKPQVEPVYSDSVQAGTIVEQAPVAGTPAASTVVLTVSLGPGRGGVSVPDLAGMTSGQAESALRATGLFPTWLHASGGTDFDKVLDQAPSPGTRVPQHAHVGVVVIFSRN